MVLEVDHTTDARRGKLPLYESWGFPEMWVDVVQRDLRRRVLSGLTGRAMALMARGGEATAAPAGYRPETA